MDKSAKISIAGVKMCYYSDFCHLIVGSQSELTIKELAGIEIIWDTTKPDVTPRKLMASSKLYEMGWTPKIALNKGIEEVYDEFKNTLSR